MAEETHTRLPLFVFHSGFPKTSGETRREAFFFVPTADRQKKNISLGNPCHKWDDQQLARKKRNNKMTEQMEERLIIQSCSIAENGGYCGEQKRRVAKRLKEEGLIKYEEVEGKCHKLRFLGFTAEGRTKYLDGDGNIKAEYLVTKVDV